MRTDITPEYLEAFEDAARWRIQYLVFHWPDGDQYVAGSRYEYAPGLFCDALVTDWGSISDAVDPEAFISGTGNATRQMNVKIANTSDSGWWCSKFAVPPENTVVDLYQAVEGVGTPLLVGRFIMQSPVRYSEASSDAEITLLSANQAVDPYVGILDPVSNNFYPVTIGTVSGVPGTLYGKHPLVKLDGDINVGATMIKTDRPVSPAGFPASGTLIIDYDVVSYTGVNGVNFTGCSGVLSRHSDGQYVFKSGHEYIFAICAGPVVDISNVKDGEGLVFDGSYNIYKDRNPVQVGFIGGFPYKKKYKDIEKIIISRKLRDNQWVVYSPAYKTLTNSDYGIRLTGKFSKNQDIFYVRTGAVVEPLGKEFIGAISSFGSAEVSGEGCYEIVFVVVLCGKTYKYNVGKSNAIIIKDLSNTSSSKEDSLSIDSNEVYALGYGELYNGSSRTIGNPFGEIELKLEAEFGLKYKEYAESIRADVNVSMRNPADIISWLLTKKECSSYIDATSFSAALAWFDSNRYNMAGLIDGGKRCSEAINDVCRQSRCYVTWDADRVYLQVRFNINSLHITYASFESSRKTKSIEIERQDFAMGSKELGASQRQGGVINKLTVRYNKQLGDGDYAARYEATHPSSIGLVGEQADILDAYLIPDAAMAKSIGDFWVGETALPYSKVKFGTVGIDGALQLQIGDPVALYTEWTAIEYFVGMVVDLKRQLGQMSPSPRANTWDVLLAGFITPRKKVSLSATMGFRGARATRGPLRVTLPIARMGFRAASLVLHMIPVVRLYARFGYVGILTIRGPLRVVLPVARMGCRAASFLAQLAGGFGYGPFGNFFWKW